MDTYPTRLQKKQEVRSKMQSSIIIKKWIFFPSIFPIISKNYAGLLSHPAPRRLITQKNTIYHKKYMTKNQQPVTSLCLIILKTCHQDCCLLGRHHADIQVDTNTSKENAASICSIVQEEQAMWKRNKNYIWEVQDMWLEYSPFLFGKLIFTRCWA